MRDRDSSARDTILARLRAALAAPAFRDEPTSYPPERKPLATVGGGTDALVAALGAKLTNLGGGFDSVPDDASARARIAELILGWERPARSGTQSGVRSSPIEVLIWAPEHVPLLGLDEDLGRSGVRTYQPGDLRVAEELERCAAARIGLTGVDAAIAATGTLVLSGGPGRSRAASLLPERHLAVVPTSRIHRSLEAWLAHVRTEGKLDAFLRNNRQIFFVTGPSKSADIELNLTLGVHGPGYVHAVVYDDGGPAAPAES